LQLSHSLTHCLTAIDVLPESWDASIVAICQLSAYSGYNCGLFPYRALEEQKTVHTYL